MIMDKCLMFFEDETITATKASPSLDVGENVGEGEPIYIFAKVVSDFTGGTSIALALQESDNNSSFTNVLSTPAIPVNDAGAGYDFKFGSVPRKLKRYLRLNATVVGAVTGGKITAGLNLDN